MVFFLFASCEDKMITKRTYTAYTPVYMSYADLRASVNVSQQPNDAILKVPGKIYFYNNYIFVNEQQKGIHVYDNSNPANPVHHAFINIPGNVDMAIKDNLLYADSYVDLVSIDISDFNNLREVSRVENVFPYIMPEIDYLYPIAQLDENKGVVIDWKVETVTDTVNYNLDNFVFFEKMDYSANEGGWISAPAEASGGGVGGSMARFIIYQNYFYVLKNYELEIFDISSNQTFTSVEKITTRAIAETVFISGDKLFVGTQTGMQVYNIFDAAKPTYLSGFEHARSCDPVVVKGNTAYVTLRGGTACGGFENQLDVIDITDIKNPILLKTYPMTSPHGLGIGVNNTLFICDGDQGLKVYDATDPLTISSNLLAHFEEINMYDVIPLNHLLVAIGADGLYQYDFSDLQNIKLLSKIAVEQGNVE